MLDLLQITNMSRFLRLSFEGYLGRELQEEERIILGSIAYEIMTGEEV